MAPFEKYTFEINAATRCVLKYIDAVGSNYGTQLRLKGKFGEGATEEMICFVPGKATDNFNTLLAEGIIKQPPAGMPQQREERPVGCPVIVPNVIITMRQPSGEKYPTFQIMAAAGRPQQRNPLQAPIAPEPKLDLAPRRGEVTGPIAPPPREAGDEPEYDGENEATDWHPPAEPTLSRDEVVVSDYSDMLDLALTRIVPIYEKRGVKIREHPEAVAAVVATLFIEANKRR